MKLTFFGGARSVTGSNYLLDNGTVKILIDCGLNQGTKYAEDLNYQSFKYNPAEIKYVLVTHSHIDHIGRLPKLFKDGFRGRIITTSATRDLMAVALPDNMKQISEEAKNDGHEPLFFGEDLEGMMNLVEGVEYGQEINLESSKVIFHDAGHILGAAIIEVNWSENGQNKKILFSGDLGNPPTPLLKPTEVVKGADYIVIESAYGDRVHEERGQRKQRLISIINETINRKGVLLIPSFAIERTQELLFELNDFFNNKQIKNVPVFIDSPLAIKMTAVYKKHQNYFNLNAEYMIKSGDDVFNFPGLKLTSSTEESKKINNIPGPKIIIAGSGMSQGGRILHHEIRYLPDPNSAILFVGYQVDGSLGRRIQRGEKTVRIMGQETQVNCHVENISSYSAHADQKMLLDWVYNCSEKSGIKVVKPKNVFVVQGEEEAAKTLSNLVRENLNVPSVAPIENESFTL